MKEENSMESIIGVALLSVLVLIYIALAVWMVIKENRFDNMCRKYDEKIQELENTERIQELEGETGKNTKLIKDIMDKLGLYYQPAALFTFRLRISEDSILNNNDMNEKLDLLAKEMGLKFAIKIASESRVVLKKIKEENNEDKN